MKSPVLAILSAAIAGYLMFHLRTDLTYWMRNKAAVDVGDARRATLPPPNSFVTLSGAPDRSNAAMLDTRGKDEFRQFFRLLGTDSKVMVLRTFGRLPNQTTLADRFTGRLIAFRDLSFGDSVREWFRTRVVATHLFDPAKLRQVIDGGQSDIADLAGDKVHLTPDSRLALDLAFPDQYRVTMPRWKFPTEADARRALDQAAFTDVEPARLPVELPESADVFVLVGRPRPEVREGVIKTITALDPRARVAPNPADPAELYASIPKSVYPSGLEGAEKALENIGFEGADQPPFAFNARVPAAKRDASFESLEEREGRIGIQQRTETVERTFAALGKNAGGLDFALVARAKLIEPLVIPDDARVLVEADSPSAYWYVPIMYVLLLAVLGFNLFALREALPWRSASSTR